MSLWSTLTTVTRVGLDLSRSALAFGERVSPWPLSIVPRVLRLPVDFAADVVGHVAGSPVTHAPPPASGGRPPHDEPLAGAVVQVQVGHVGAVLEGIEVDREAVDL